MHFEIFNPVF